MPTNLTWVGTDSGNEGDWGTAANWSPAQVPISGDSVFIVSGSEDIDGDDQNAVVLARLVVGTKYSGSIGSSGTKLQISATDFDYSGRGDTCYIEGDFTTVTVQETSTNANALNLYGEGDDDITTLRVLGGRGTINVDASQDLTTVECIGADGVTLVIADSTDLTGASLTMDSGTVEANQAFPTMTIFGGECVCTFDTGTVTTFNQYGGRVRWNPTAACTITTLVIYAGLFDSRESTSPAYTITDCTIHEQGQLDERSGLSNATYTNPINCEGGEILLIDRLVTIT